MMKIQKLDLKKLGFKKNHITACESGDKPYDYYNLNIGNDYNKFCLMADEKEGVFEVRIFDYTSFVFTETTELTLLINILKNNYGRNNKATKRKKLYKK